MDRRTSANRRAGGPRWVPEIFDNLVTEVRTGGRPVVYLDPPQLVVAALDRRGLLAAVVGTLGLHDLDIRRADVIGRDGVAIDSFVVRSTTDVWPERDELRDDLESVLTGRLTVPDHLATRAQASGAEPPAHHLVAPAVVMDNLESESSTVVEVHSTDEAGFLYRLTKALFDAGLDVVSARVSTFGDAAVDVFYVRTSTGKKVTDPDALEAIQRSLHRVVG
jgi:[protein-PII] uridylyltransferase